MFQFLVIYLEFVFLIRYRGGNKTKLKEFFSVRFRKEVESRTFPKAVKRSEPELPKLYIGTLFLFRVQGNT